MQHPPCHHVEVRQLPPDAAEFLAALHLAMDLNILPAGTTAAPAVTQLLEGARKQGVSLELVYGAFERGALVSAVFAMEAPGGAALAFVPTGPTRQDRSPATAAALRALWRHAGKRGIKLLEVLIDPASTPPIRALSEVGFRRLTTLRYLRRSGSRTRPFCRTRVGLAWADYDTAGETVFGEAIESSYAQSLDCPELTGLRSIRDVLAGHRAVGEFDPRWWWVATRRRTPVGVILLNGIAERRALEVVYMGVAPSARGTGVGDTLLARALDIASSVGANILALAVDERNVPARRLYQRWGFQEVGLRDAWIAPRRRWTGT